tara:strand:- start:340 stop:471 length:132 start_codon:yes stop_codon:yes gene_type:complete
MRIIDIISKEKKEELDNFWCYLYAEWYREDKKFDKNKDYALPF